MRAASIRNAGLLLGPLLSACATPQEAAPPVGVVQPSVERIASALVELAARRADLSAIRASVLTFHGDGTPDAGIGRVTTGGRRADLVGTELRREFELALANRLHVVEPHAIDDEPPANPASASSEVASHAVVGEYALRGVALLVSVRLVDLETHLVVSAARDSIPLTWLTLQARAQLQVSSGALGNTV